MVMSYDVLFCLLCCFIEVLVLCLAMIFAVCWLYRCAIVMSCDCSFCLFSRCVIVRSCYVSCFVLCCYGCVSVLHCYVYWIGLFSSCGIGVSCDVSCVEVFGYSGKFVKSYGRVMFCIDMYLVLFSRAIVVLLFCLVMIIGLFGFYSCVMGLYCGVSRCFVLS